MPSLLIYLFNPYLCLYCLIYRQGYKTWTHNAIYHNAPSLFFFQSELTLDISYRQWLQIISPQCSKSLDYTTYVSLNSPAFSTIITSLYQCYWYLIMAVGHGIPLTWLDSLLFILLCLPQRVTAARQPHWINTLLYPPYLTQSPAEVYLKGYYPDAVGMSATEKPSHESGNIFYIHVSVICFSNELVSSYLYCLYNILCFQYDWYYSWDKTHVYFYGIAGHLFPNRIIL